MGIGSSIKRQLRRFIPASRMYIDQKFADLAGEIERQRRDLSDQLPGSISGQLAGEISAAQRRTVREINAHTDQELKRRDIWETRPEEIRRLAKDRKIWVIKCPAPEDEMKVRWGDYSYALALKKYLEREGCFVVVDVRPDWYCEAQADVVLVLRGEAFYHPDRRNPGCLYIMWNISHPDMVSTEEYELYDIVCPASMHYAKELEKKLSVPVVPLLQCTDTELFYPPRAELLQAEENSGTDPVKTDPSATGKAKTNRRDYIFIGNSRGIARNCVMWSVEENLPLRMWGGGWNRILGEHITMVEAPFIENSEIPALYRASKVTLNDHWQDMLEQQFVNNRIFDALACGLPVISDGCEEAREIFPDAVLYYSNKEEFKECIRQIEENYEAVHERVLAQWDLIREKYSFEARARELVEMAKKYQDDRTPENEIGVAESRSSREEAEGTRHGN